MYILESFDKELYEKDLKQNAYEDGMQDGLKKGEVQGELNRLISQIKIKLSKGKSVTQIADELEETVETVQTLIEKMK